MRPLRLEMTAFGPYLNPQVIDFRQLGDERLFLITGPTGSGKTTVLDAICYALYGTTSGRERDGAQMRHGLAPAHLATEVTFDFAIGPKCYRVRRSPKQQTAKKEGGKLAAREATAALWRRADNTASTEDGEAVEARTRETTNAVVELLGFSDDQFRQVIMLPQGEFRQVLCGASSTREQLLQTLFRIDMYSRIQDALRARFEAAREELRQLESQRDLLLQERKVTKLAELHELIATRRAEQQQLEESLDGLRAAEAAAREALALGKAAGVRLAEHRDAAAMLAAFEERKPQIVQLGARVQAAHAANSIRPVEVEARRRRTEKDTADGELKRADEAAKARLLAFNAALEKQQRESAREPDRETARRRLLELGALAEVAAELTRLRAASVDAKRAVASLAKQETTLRTRLALAEKECADGAARLAQMRLEAAGAVARREAAREARRVLEDFRALAQQRRDHAWLTKSIATDNEAAKKCEGQWKEALEEVRRLEQARTQNAAAALAETLAEGEPCPVCGSVHHPAKAAADAAAPTPETIKKARALVDAHAQTLETLREKLAEARERAASLAGSAAMLQQRLGEVAASPEAALAEAEKSALAAATVAEKSTRELPAAEAQQTAREADRDAVRGQLDAALAELQQAQIAAAGALAAMAPHEARLPEEIRGPGALELAIADARLAQQVLDKSFHDAQDSLTKAKAELAAADEAVRQLRDRAAVAEKALAEQRAAMQAALRDAGFADFKSYEAAWGDFAKAPEFTREIEEFHRQFGAAQERLAKAARDAEGITAPDFAALETADNLAREAARSAERKRGALAQELEALASVVAKVAELDALALAKRHHCEQVIGPVAQALDGKPPNTQGVSLQRYVLGAMLEEVLEQSSRRLRLMSRGRYELRLLGGKLKGRQIAGLDLEVYDDYTGKTRPVSTLSGGEAFLASLALALGLADVVQARTGGVRLETIFIDEGFGSLDPEALDLAMCALKDLQEGGRLVGAISHVEEMKQQIAARLEIVPGRIESRARFVVPGLAGI